MQSYESDVKSLSSIKVVPYFATYTGEDNSDYYFDLNFSLLQSYIIKFFLSKVEVKIYNKNVSAGVDGTKYVSYSNDIATSISSQNNIHKILLKTYNQSNLAKQKVDSLIATATVGSLENAVLEITKSELKSGKNPKDIASLYYPVYTIEPLTDFELQSLNVFTSAHSKNDIQKLNLELLTNNLIDPAEVVQDSQKNSTLDIVKNIRKFYISQKPFDTTDELFYKKVSKQQFIDRVNFFAKVKIPKKYSEQILDIHFDVYTSKSTVPLEIKKLQLDVNSFLKYSKVIKAEPKLGYSENSKIIVGQEDVNANAIQTYRKEINDIGEISNYSLVDDSNILYKKRKLFSALKSKGKVFIYRSIPYELPSGKKSSFFGSLIVGDPMNLDQTSMVIVDKPNAAASLQIKIYNIPAFVSHVKVERKQIINNAIREDTKTVVVNYDYIKDISNSVVLEDNFVKNDEIYEYTLFYKTKTGEERRSRSQIYRYVNSAIATSVSTVISSPNLTVENGEPSFSFSLSSQIKEKEANKIKSHLKNADIFEEFQNEMEKVNDTFNNLIFHRVIRINLKTGQRELFDDIPVEGTFTDDHQTRKKFSVSKLDPRTSYHYEVRVSLRDPITLFRDYVKVVTVSIGRGTKTYAYRPYRWRQPTTLKNGTILAADSEGNIISTNSLFEDGEIGVTATYTLASLASTAIVKDLFAERLDVNKIKVTWDVEGDENNYDHYVISKEVNGKKHLIGSCQGKEFIDVVDISNDMGTVFYQVTPVFMDYSVGSASRSNATFIDPNEFFSTYSVLS